MAQSHWPRGSASSVRRDRITDGSPRGAIQANSPTAETARGVPGSRGGAGGGEGGGGEGGGGGAEESAPVAVSPSGWALAGARGRPAIFIAFRVGLWRGSGRPVFSHKYPIQNLS